jgi:hypothetical protein
MIKKYIYASRLFNYLGFEILLHEEYSVEVSF